MKRVAKAAIIPLTIAGLIALGWWLIHDAKFDVLNPSGDIALQQRRILFFTLSLAAVVVIPVFVMLVMFAWRYREGRKNANYRPEWQENKWLELAWWGIPVAIIATLGTVTWFTSHQLDPYQPIKSDNKTLEVQVVALEWKWLFIYPDLGIATVNQLPIPEKTPVHFTLTADAPMSAFWVPSLGSQIYVMNGMSSQLHLIANDTGVYEGYNTNINGSGYSDMKFTVESMSKAKFDDWATRTRAEAAPLDDATYKKLAEQGAAAQKTVYRSVDGELFDTILGKYMHGGDAMSSDDMNMEDHTMHMPDMNMSHEMSGGGH